MAKKKKFPDAEDWEHNLAFLSMTMRSEPIAFICFFTGNHTVYKVRDSIIYLFQAAMGSDMWRDDEPEEKADKMLLMVNLIELVELAYLVDEMTDDGTITYQINRKKA
jgi:hypothetical protein